MIEKQISLALNTGILLAVPIPKEFSLDPQEIERAIKKGIESAKLNNITGKEVTPFLLTEMSKLTGGRTLESSV